MNDEISYISKMDKSMEDKLFFLDFIPMLNGKINVDVIIDCGCATGNLLKTLIKMNLIDLEKTTLIGVDKYFTVKDSNIYYLSSFYELFHYLEQVPKNKAIFTIWSSVLHECGKLLDYLLKIMDKSTYISIRDMYFDNTYNLSQYIDPNVNFLNNDNSKYTRNLLKSIKNNLINTKILYQYFLKYTYIANYSTEVKEDYFSVDYDLIIKYLAGPIYSHFVCLNDTSYTLQYKKEKIKEDFNYDLKLPTHRKLFFAREV